MSSAKMYKNITYSDAVNLAIVQEMERDDSIFIYGVEDKLFGTLKGIKDRFGGKRIFPTPISEECGLGFGLGAALNGLRPINVHIRVDFLMLAMNQLANMISSTHYGSAGKLNVPLVIRAVIGRGWGQGYQHSKSLQGMFAQIPGLKVIMPTTPYDAKGMLAAAIRDNNPVLVLEHRWLYWQTGDVPYEPYTIEFGLPIVRNYGSDVTIVATSWMNVEALHAAQILKRRGVSLEIIDPRSINPLNEDIIVKSVHKTGRCIVADNDWVNSGFSAELAARIYNKCWKILQAPITRIGFAETPCPTTRNLEQQFYPNSKDIVRAVEKQLRLEESDLSEENFYSHENRFLGPF